MKDNCIVYVHITPNNKLYIGITSTTLENRSCGGRNYTGQYFSNAIKKYGWDNIKHLILIENLTWEVACECEKYLISKYKTNNPEFGYNLTNGGEGLCGYKHTEGTKRKIGSSNKNKIRSIEQKEHLRKLNIDKIKNNPQIVKNQQETAKRLWGTEEYRKKVIKAHTGYVMPDSQKDKIRKGNLGKKYSTVTKSKISEIVKAQHLKERQLGIIRDTKRSKPVLQYSLDGTFIARYNSGRQAAIALKISPMVISNCCNNKIKSGGGYIWRFENM